MGGVLFMKSLVKVLGIQERKVDGLLLESGETLKLPLCILPKDIKSGDVLRLEVNFDPYETILALHE